MYWFVVNIVYKLIQNTTCYWQYWHVTFCHRKVVIISLNQIHCGCTHVKVFFVRHWYWQLTVPVWQISKQQAANQESRHVHWLGGGSHPFLITHEVPLKSVKARFTKNNLERSIIFFVLQNMYNNQEIEQRKKEISILYCDIFFPLCKRVLYHRQCI